VSGENRVRTENFITTLFPSNLKCRPDHVRRLSIRPLLPEAVFCRPVAEGRVRSLLVIVVSVLGFVFTAAAPGVVAAPALAVTRGSPAQGESQHPQNGAVAGTEVTTVSPSERAPDGAEINAAVKHYLTSVTRWQEDEIEVLGVVLQKMTSLPGDDIALRARSRGAPAGFANLTLLIDAVRKGKVLRSFWVRANVRVRARVVQMAKPVAFHGVIQAEDLSESVCEITDPRGDYFRSAAEAVGWTAKRALGTGELLGRNCVDEASLVRNGETVKLLVQSHSVHMSLTVRALQSGKLGDPIKVRNTNSDRVFTAIVTGRGEVRVAN
jgi:flagella basal body P-ring formation protein FlgA